ncbi:unnamed protein product [Acanthosepion pharaonis]|uniref:Uncharacterized protein n=1 Tax=Acanthosepion pharaonis TaxID=158019 RepID=A0A812DRH7_ACAPH|nr:unnamed protein product [Sepia pharaonis]
MSTSRRHAHRRLQWNLPWGNIPPDVRIGVDRSQPVHDDLVPLRPTLTSAIFHFYLLSLVLFLHRSSLIFITFYVPILVFLFLFSFFLALIFLVSSLSSSPPFYVFLFSFIFPLSIIIFYPLSASFHLPFILLIFSLTFAFSPPPCPLLSLSSFLLLFYCATLLHPIFFLHYNYPLCVPLYFLFSLTCSFPPISSFHKHRHHFLRTYDKRLLIVTVPAPDLTFHIKPTIPVSVTTSDIPSSLQTHDCVCYCHCY